MGILVVNNMLITGFDAPVEQVLYLDRVIADHNLLQAIARVNRVEGDTRDKGFMVDYVGIGHHLKRAIAAYDERELKLTGFWENIPARNKLRADVCNRLRHRARTCPSARSKSYLPVLEYRSDACAKDGKGAKLAKGERPNSRTGHLTIGGNLDSYFRRNDGRLFGYGPLHFLQCYACGMIRRSRRAAGQTSGPCPPEGGWHRA